MDTVWIIVGILVGLWIFAAVLKAAKPKPTRSSSSKRGGTNPTPPQSGGQQQAQQPTNNPPADETDEVRRRREANETTILRKRETESRIAANKSKRQERNTKTWFYSIVGIGLSALFIQWITTEAVDTTTRNARTAGANVMHKGSIAHDAVAGTWHWFGLDGADFVIIFVAACVFLYLKYKK